MSRIRLKQLDELDRKTKTIVQKMESEGKDTSTIRGLANSQPLFDSYFKFYGPAREGKSISAELIELVRLRIARHNDCFTWLNARLLQGAESELTEEKIAMLDDRMPDFSLEEKTAIEFADKMALDHKSLDDDFFHKLHICFSDEQILELGMMIGPVSYTHLTLPTNREV